MDLFACGNRFIYFKKAFFLQIVIYNMSWEHVHIQYAVADKKWNQQKCNKCSFSEFEFENKHKRIDH